MIQIVYTDNIIINSHEHIALNAKKLLSIFTHESTLAVTSSSNISPTETQYGSGGEFTSDRMATLLEPISTTAVTVSMNESQMIPTSDVLTPTLAG